MSLNTGSKAARAIQEKQLVVIEEAESRGFVRADRPKAVP